MTTRAKGTEVAENIRVGVLGLVHDHVWENLKHLQELEAVDLVGAADPHEALLERFREQTGVATTCADAAELLEAEPMDAVLVYGTNLGSGELVEMAAERGLHVMSEKPMASDLAVADRMLVAARKAGVLLMINWPSAWNPALHCALDLVARGAIGRVWQLKWRGGHRGPKEMGCDPYFYNWLYDPIENGGGALVDYLGYGASLARLFIGQPIAVFAIAGRLVKQDIAVDDNAIIALEYHDANAVIEATWSEAVFAQPAHDVVVYGTGGTLVVARGHVTVHTPENPSGETFQPTPLEAPHRNGPQHFLHCIRSGNPVEGMCSPENSLDAQEVIEAARLSVVTGQKIPLPLVDHLYAL